MSEFRLNNGDPRDHDTDDDHLSVATRLTLVRQSIIETAINHTSDKFTIFRSINRTIFAFNGPIVFAFIEKKPRHYKLILDSIYDPMNADAFYAALRNIGFRSGKINISDAKIVKSVFVKIFDTEYFLIPFTTKYLSDRTPFKQSPLTFEPLNPDSTAHKFLSRTFDAFGSSLETLKLGRDFQDHIRTLFHRSTTIQAAYDDPETNPAPPPRQLNSDLSILTPGGPRRSMIKKLDNMILNEIMKISDSPLLSTPDADAPNIMLFTKRFTRQSQRFGHYYYDSIPFLPPTLVERYVKSLETSGCKHLIPFPSEKGGSNTRRWFEAAIDKRAISEISSVATSPLSAGLRLCVDYVMRTGAGLVYYNPFKDGYIGWIEDDIPDKVQEYERKRLAILHYFLQAGDPLAKNPYLLLMPVRVSGSVYMVTASVVDGDKCEPSTVNIASEANTPLVSSDEFQYRTFLYHSILRHFESRIRKKSKETYLESVADIISDAVRTAQGPELTLAAYETLNERLISLCRFYPYDPISIDLGINENLQNKIQTKAVEGIRRRKIRIAGGAQQVHFALHDGSPFYDRVRLHDFLDPDSTRRRLEDMINARFGGWRAYDEGHNA